MTGLSMGGFGTWALAACHAGPFRRPGADLRRRRSEHGQETLSCAGLGLPRSERPGRAAGRSEKMVEALKKAGGNVKFTVYPEAGHDSWTEAYNTPELYKWLLQQKRTAKK